MSDANETFEAGMPAPQAAINWLPSAWLTLIVLSILGDFSMAPIITGSYFREEISVVLGLSVIGSTLAQGVLLAAWLVWSTAPIGQRLGIHWAIAAGLCWVWLVGVSVSTVLGSTSLRDYAFVGFSVPLCVPLVSLAAQLPLWAMRHFCGWRLVAVGAKTNARSESLTIRDILLATLVVAVAFGLARQSPYAREVKGFAAAWAIAGVVAGTISTLAMLPAAAIFLRQRSLGGALALGGLYAALLVGILWTAVGILYWRGISLPPYFAFLGLTGLMLSFAATVMLAGAVARVFGLRLVWGRQCSRGSPV